MNNAAKPPSADELLLPRLSDDDAVEIQRFLDHLFEAGDGDQINRLHDSLSRDKLVGYDGETARADARTRVNLRAALESALEDVRAAVTDWPALRGALACDADELVAEAGAAAGTSEGAELLRWLHNDMLTQLGHVERRRDGTQNNPLGICRKSARELLAPANYLRAFAWFDAKGEQAAALAPLVVKANVISQVHRRVPLDLFIVPKMKRGRVTALSVHATGVRFVPKPTGSACRWPQGRPRQARLNVKFRVYPHFMIQGVPPDS